MSKTAQRATSIYAGLLLVLTAPAVPALAAASDFAVAVIADTENAKPGDIVSKQDTGRLFRGF